MFSLWSVSARPRPRDRTGDEVLAFEAELEPTNHITGIEEQVNHRPATGGFEFGRPFEVGTVSP
jgi:hypothetical protein